MRPAHAPDLPSDTWRAKLRAAGFEPVDEALPGALAQTLPPAAPYSLEEALAVSGYGAAMDLVVDMDFAAWEIWSTPREADDE